jgi:glucokinase
LRWKGRIRLASMMEEAMGAPAVMTNDANAAALGEMIYGHAKGLEHFIVITIGTGLGSGIVVDGEMVYGKTGFAGEMGHTTAVRWGRRCSCGKDGCLEAYVSARGLRTTALELLEEFRYRSLLAETPPERLNAKAIFDAAMRNDEVAIRAFEFTGEVLGASLADAVAYTSPEAIFLFGGLAKSGDLLFGPTQRSLDHNLLDIFAGTVKLMPSALNDQNGAILGAAALACKTYWKD